MIALWVRPVASSTLLLDGDAVDEVAVLHLALAPR
jgi:hypothetical protein